MKIGTHIGQYRIVRTIGAGGMGTVFLGEHILLGRRAAIKTLHSKLSSHPEIVERFFTEARATAAISDPGVVQIFDFGYHVDSTAYIVMELLEGEPLSARIERLGRVPVVEALRIARQIAASVGAAHAHGIVHRDLKPENVFLVRDAEAPNGERTKILDFGVCKLDRDDASVTQTGTMLGTPVYMSPEQCRGDGRVDHRSDVYSIGCALFHMLTGRPPFDDEAVGEIIASHLRAEPPVPSELVAALPAEVDVLVLRCLAKAPDQRFQSMAALQTSLEELLAQLATSVATEQRQTPVPVSTALGEGFRSAYDPSRDPAAPPTLPWHVDGDPTANAYMTPAPRRRVLPRARFVVALAGVALAAGMTQLATGADAVIAVPPSPPRAVESEPPSAIREVAPDVAPPAREKQAPPPRPIVAAKPRPPTHRTTAPRPKQPAPLAEAEQLFQDGRALIQQGQLPAGCDKLEASARAELSAGTLLDLGDCREKLGRFASAWAAFRQAEDLAKRTGDDAEREAEAHRRALRVEPLVPELVIAIGPHVDGLVVRRNGEPVAAAGWNTAAPVDPGTYTVVVEAPGYMTFRGEIVVPPKVRRTVVVPALERVAEPGL